MLKQLSAPRTVYYVVRVVAAFAFTLIITYEFVLHTITAGLTPLQLIMVGVVHESMTVLFEVPTGVVADAYSRRWSVIIGVFLFGLGFLVEGIFPVLRVILLAQVLWGIGFTFISGALTAWITDEIGEQETRPLLLRAMQVVQPVRLAAVVLAIGLANISIQLPIVVGASINFLLGGYLLIFMREDNFRPKKSTASILKQTLQPFQESVQLVRIRPILMTIMLLGVVIGISMGGFDRLHTPYLNEKITFPDIGVLEAISWFGILRGIVALLTIAGTEWARRRNLDGNAAVMRTLSILYSGMIIGTFLFALTSNFVLAALGYCLSQTLRNVSRPLLTIWINQNATSEVRATVISLYWQANAMGQVVGTPPLGWIAIRSSVRAALAIAALIYTLTLPLLRVKSNPKQA